MAERRVDDRGVWHAEDELLEADPGSRWCSASSRSLVAASSSKIACRCSSSSAMPTSTLSPLRQVAGGIRRCVSNWRTSATGGSDISRRGGRRAAGEPSASPAGRRGSCSRAASGRRRSGWCSAAAPTRRPGARPCRMSQRLEDADQIRDAHQPVGVERCIGLPLHFVERPVADTAKQRPRVFVAHLPAPHDVEKSLEARGRQPLALAPRAEIGRRTPSGSGWLDNETSAAGCGLLFRSIFAPDTGVKPRAPPRRRGRSFSGRPQVAVEPLQRGGDERPCRHRMTGLDDDMVFVR